MAIFRNKHSDEQELGFGSKDYKKNVRFLNKDGGLNVKRSGLGGINNLDIYHWLISASPIKLLAIIFFSYLFINLIFAGVYYLVGAQNFGGLDVNPNNEFQKFMGLFFFSAQTITTLGYGHIYPIGNAASIAAAFESLLGLLSFALATGVLYGRFSRPRAHILYSKNILIAPYKDKKALMFRITNKKQYELIEAEANVSVSLNNSTTNKREFFNLKLEIQRINFLALSWTLVHPLDENSPLNGLTLKGLEERDTEFIILIKAINDTYSQTVYSRYSYKTEDMIENARFRALSQFADNTGRVIISVNDIHLYDKLS